ncbi:hypothetical protein DAMA08_036190 [Martiniozyma asiatica (nom. inval.)]|nr:hypothetical protein DAMA08_036190 [Martiniozyma asiatica]
MVLTEPQLDYVQSQKAITAVQFSRKFKIPTKYASELLKEFHNDEPSYKIKYTVCLSTSRGTTIKLVDEPQSTPDTISCQVFSISIADVINPVVKFNYEGQMEKLGLIMTKTDSRNDNDTQIAQEIKLESEPVSKRIEKSSTTSTNKASPVKEESSRYVSRKAATHPQIKATSKIEYVSRKRKSGVISDSFKDAPDEDDDDPEEQITKKTKVMSEEERNKKKEQDHKLANLFEDDDEFSDDDSLLQKPQIETNIDVASESPKKQVESPKKQVESIETHPPVESLQLDQEPIEEFQTETDADGFIVTKRAAKPKPKSTKPVSQRAYTIETSKPKAESKSTRKQTSIMGFFKKK